MNQWQRILLGVNSAASLVALVISCVVLWRSAPDGGTRDPGAMAGNAGDHTGSESADGRRSRRGVGPATGADVEPDELPARRPGQRALQPELPPEERPEAIRLPPPPAVAPSFVIDDVLLTARQSFAASTGPDGSQITGTPPPAPPGWDADSIAWARGLDQNPWQLGVLNNGAPPDGALRTALDGASRTGEAFAKSRKIDGADARAVRALFIHCLVRLRGPSNDGSGASRDAILSDVRKVAEREFGAETAAAMGGALSALR